MGSPRSWERHGGKPWQSEGCQAGGIPRQGRVTGCCDSSMGAPQQRGRPRAPQGWVSAEQKTPSGPPRPPRRILLADTHRRDGQMFQLLLSHPAVHGLPHSLNHSLMIPLVPGGRAGVGGSAPAPRGGRRHKPKITAPAWEAPACMDLREKSIPPRTARVLHRWGILQPDLKPGQAGALLFRQRLAGTAKRSRCEWVCGLWSKPVET